MVLVYWKHEKMNCTIDHFNRVAFECSDRNALVHDTSKGSHPTSKHNA